MHTTITCQGIQWIDASRIFGRRGEHTADSQALSKTHEVIGLVKTVHRFDKMGYVQELGRLECVCNVCRHGDNAICNREGCLCCTVP